MSGGLALAAVCIPLCFVLVQLMAFLVGCYRARSHFLASLIPGPPLTSQCTGHLPNIAGPRGPWQFARWADGYGPLYKVQFLNIFAVILTDPAEMSRVTRKAGPGPYFPKPRQIYEVLEVATRPKAANILTADDGDYWRAVRQAASPCFSMSNLKQVVPLVLELTQHVANRMAQHASFDVTDAAKRITSDVMGQLLYGEDLRGVHWEPSEYLDTLDNVLKAETALFNNPFHLWKLWDPEVRLQRRCLAKHDALMGEKVAALRQNPPAAHTIAAHVLSAIDPATGKPLDDARAKGEVATFMAAGFETVSHAITWCLTLLATYADVQQQVYEELQQAGLAARPNNSSSGREFAASDLNSLPLLSAAIKEALRLCTPVPFGCSRLVTEQGGAELCGHHVPQGTIVMMPLLPYGLSVHNYGADSWEFKPWRWLAAAGSDLGSATHPPSSPNHQAAAGHAPPDPFTFMTGQRDCIGQNLAKLELQVVLATLLSRFRFSPGPELERELQLAAATGQSVVRAVHALAIDRVTLQPLSGQMMLRLGARG